MGIPLLLLRPHYDDVISTLYISYDKRMSGLMQIELNIFIIRILFIVACVWLSLSYSQGHFSGISNFIMSVNFISFSFNLYFCIRDNEELHVLQCVYCVFYVYAPMKYLGYNQLYCFCLLF